MTIDAKGLRKALVKATLASPLKWDEPANWHGLSLRICTEKDGAPLATIDAKGWPLKLAKARASLIVAAVNALPDLLDELERLRGEVASLRAGGGA